MKLSPEQLVDWFLAANPNFPPELRTEFLAAVNAPPKGAKRSDIISGAKQAINDTLAASDCWTAEYRKQIDDSLSAKGLPSMRKMEFLLKKKHKLILARGSIKNDEEYYIVSEMLSDLEFEISEADRVALEMLSYTYEKRTR